MIRSYFRELEKYENKYKNKVILLWQCGSFLEVYGKKRGDRIYGSDILEFSRICDMTIANKKKCTNKEEGVVMAGFSPITKLDKHVKKMCDNGYTVAVWLENEEDHTNRYEHGVFSPGTFFNTEKRGGTNNIMCLWVDITESNLLSKQSLITCGMSVIDIFTGKVNMFEYTEEYFHNPTTFDEIERFHSIYMPSETIVIHSSYEKIDDIISFSGINSKSIHIHEDKDFKHLEKQVYQKELLKKFYRFNDYDSFYDSLPFKEYPVSTQSFCFLLNFIFEHNPDLVYNISQPIFDNITERLILANHSLKQLNIIDDKKGEGKMGSVVSFINRCKTTMGLRKFNSIILSPITNEKELTKEYDIVEYIKDNYDGFKGVRHNLGNIKDLQKLYRKMILHKVAPCELSFLHEDIVNIGKMNEFVRGDTILSSYFPIDVGKHCVAISTFIRTHIDIHKAANKHSIDENIFLKNVYPDLDLAEQKHMQSLEKMTCLKKFFSELIRRHEPKCKEPVKIHETEKSGLYLMATKNRINNKLKKNLPRKETSLALSEGTSLTFDPRQLKFVSGIGSNMRFSGNQLNSIYLSISYSKIELRSKIRETYKKFIKSLERLHSDLERVIDFVTNLDIIITKSYVSKKYNYCKPIIDSSKDRSFVDVTKLRHLLVEHLQTDEIYVPNDICLGEEMRGLALFGTNSVGKSCFIRSIGIAVILAQSGMFVPAERFVYKPYTSIFTRILGNDDIFKGLSTFAVEMSEFRTILRLSDQNSLILGDELCRGTETNSAISIFVAGLMLLHKKKGSFVFATHFHEIIEMKEIKEMNHLFIKHMKVKYNMEENKLIYDRKLHDGGGDNMYGLEVCKSLNLPQNFLELALSIREIAPKKNRYNSSKLGGPCELCGGRSDDVHHLRYQREAGEEGFIGHFHKNHVANLVNICRECHIKTHKRDLRYEKKKTSNGVELLLISDDNNI